VPPLVGIAMRDKPIVLADDESKALIAHVNAVDHSPELFERNFADYPARVLLRSCQAHRDSRRRQKVVIHFQRRNIGSIRPAPCPIGDPQSRLSERARGQWMSGAVE